MRRDNSEFQTNYVSQAGTPKVNKDYFGFVEMDDYACFVVADGLDTDREVCASKIIVDYILGSFTSKPGMSKHRMKMFMRQASELLQKESIRMRLKASIVIVITDYIKVRWCVAGNSRFYLFRNQKVLCKSKDQSFYQHDIDLGKIPNDGSREFDERHNLLQYMGQPKRLRPFISKKHKLFQGDVFLLCSCGFWEQFHDIEILDALDANNESEAFVLDLQEMLLSKKNANQYIGNYTAAAVFVNKVFKKPDNKMKILKIVLLIAIPLLIVGIVIGIILWQSNKKWVEKKETVFEIEQRANGYVNELDYQRAQSEYEKAVLEAADLKQKNGNKGKQNKIIKLNLNEKERISQLLADGNQYIDDKKYNKALQSSRDALKMLQSYSGQDINLGDINIQDVKDKISRCKTLLDIENQVKLADLQAVGGDYDRALKGYGIARKEAIAQGETEMEKDLSLKIAQAEATNNGAKNEAMKNEGNFAQSAGDTAMAAGDFSRASAAYRQAAASYGAAGDTQGVSAVNGKMTQIESKVSATQEQEKQQEEKAFAEELKASAKKKEYEGDGYSRKQEYERAYSAYEDAYDLYSEAEMSEKSQMIARKMDKITTAQEKQEQTERKLTAKDLDNMANKALDELDYEAAIAYLQMAQSMYQEASMNDKVLQSEGKIKDAKELKRQSELPKPTPTPMPTPTPNVIIIVPTN